MYYQLHKGCEWTKKQNLISRDFLLAKIGFEPQSNSININPQLISMLCNTVKYKQVFYLNFEILRPPLTTDTDNVNSIFKELTIFI